MFAIITSVKFWLKLSSATFLLLSCSSVRKSSLVKCSRSLKLFSSRKEIIAQCGKHASVRPQTVKIVYQYELKSLPISRKKCMVNKCGEILSFIVELTNFIFHHNREIRYHAVSTFELFSEAINLTYPVSV